MMVELEYFNGTEWTKTDGLKWTSEKLAWISLGSDNLNYRTVDELGGVLTTKQ